MEKPFLKRLPIYFLTLVSFLGRFWQIYFPPKVVFDETYFSLFAHKYLFHQYYFDIHPPLGKLFFALLLFLFGKKTFFDFKMDSFYPNLNYLILRSFVAFLGALLPILVFFLVKKTGFSERAAFLAAFLIVFDNALLVQSRFVLMDIILLFFIFLSLIFFILQKEKKPFSFSWYFYNLILGFLLGFTISIKFTGFGALAIIFIWEVLEEKLFQKPKKEIFFKIFFFFFLPLFIYFFISYIHLELLTNVCFSNCGWIFDEIWTKRISELSPEKREEVIKIIRFPPFGNKIFRVFLLSYYSLSTNTSLIDWRFSSKWYTWPFLIRPILYFQEKVDQRMRFIFLLGNPIVWWFSFLGTISFLYFILREYIIKKKPFVFQNENFRLFFLGYFVYLFPFAAIPRFTAIYHYFPSLVFSIILFSIFFDFALQKIPKIKPLFFVLLFFVILGFLYFLPFSYGFLMNFSQFKARIWLPTWYL
jgi:dolichyl-phosphate-mannose--protein O-mannosyl transferase